MKILLANNFYDPNLLGGAERSVKILAETLAAGGDDVTVVSLASNAGQTTSQINGVRVHYVQSGNLGAGLADPARTGLDRILWHLSGEHLARSTPAIADILRAKRPDVVHSFCLPGISFGIWRLAHDMHIPLVHTLYEYYLLCARGTMFRNGSNCVSRCWDCKVMTARRRAQTRYVNAVVGASQFLVDRHRRAGCFSEARMTRVIYDGTPLPDPATLDGRSQGRVLRIGFLGRLHVTKGVEVLLQAATRMSAADWTLLIAGRGAEDYEPMLRQRYSDPRIQFLGWSQADSFLRQIDVLVVPSIWNEPLGRITMEAYSYGVPVIASRRGGIPEVIDEGRSGFLFNPDEPSELTAILDRIAEHPEQLEPMRQFSLARASAEFDQEISAQKYRELCRELLASGAPD